MSMKKLDNRIRILIDNGVKRGHRSFFVIVGEKARDQVVILHQMLSKAQVKARPSVLWCYKKELGFSTHRMKRMRQLKQRRKAGITATEDDPFDFFISSTDIRWCYYHETHRILGNTYGMLVLQDFEAMTPNLLARTIETIEGGGIVVLLLSTLNSLQQLHTLSMDVHDRYRTEAYQDIVCRFNERFILSLATCPDCLVIDDKLNVLPINSASAKIEPETKSMFNLPVDPELKELVESLDGVQPTQSLVQLCKTLDQAKSLLKFIDSLSEKTLRSTVSLTASRGRGKSAALGLAIVAAIGYNYSNVLVTSPSPENLKTLFDFVLKGLDAIHFVEHVDFEVIRSNTKDNETKNVTKITIFKNHRQVIQYVSPDEVSKSSRTSNFELVVIDEAAAIPLPIVKSLLGPHLVFMASTINGYEGTGRSLSLKLLQNLRKNSTASSAASGARILHEVTLDQSIRYKSGDQVEIWLNKLLCLDSTLSDQDDKSDKGFPEPNECSLYYISRDTLFSYHDDSERFLSKLMTLYTSSHYKNSPNDLQMMSDAPAHHLFVLLPPKVKHQVPSRVLVFIQVALEGQISSDSIINSLNRGKRASGDLIPWTVSQQFQDTTFPSLSGARIIRIATNPTYQGMGYGSVAMRLLEEYYSGKLPISSLSDLQDKSGEISPKKTDFKKSLPPLLLKLNERKPELLDWLGVSFGLTKELFKFWSKSGFCPIYLRQTMNELTGENSCIVLKTLIRDDLAQQEHSWLCDFSNDFCRRFMNLLPSAAFREMNSSLALNLISSGSGKDKIETLSKQELDVHLTPYDLKRLELYSNNLVDYHLITDLLPVISRLFFGSKFDKSVSLSPVQSVILLALGLQLKTVQELERELNLPSSQILGLFNRVIRKVASYLRSISEKEAEKTIKMPELKSRASLLPMVTNLEQELEDDASKIKNSEKKELKKLSKELKDFEQFKIKGSDSDWNLVTAKDVVSIKTVAEKNEHKRKHGGEKEFFGKKKKKNGFKKKKNFGQNV